MSPEFEKIFLRLKEILKEHSKNLSITSNEKGYSLEGETGPATIQIWKGKMKSKFIPVAWIEVGKSYVSYHLMGIYGNEKLKKSISKELAARMQGKTCFNFKKIDEKLFKELEQLTLASISDFRKAGFIV